MIARVTSGETRRMARNSQRKRSHTQVRGKIFSLTTTGSRSTTSRCSMLGALTKGEDRSIYQQDPMLLMSYRAAPCESPFPS